MSKRNEIETTSGVGFGAVTLVGYLGEFPRERGNCFDLVGEDGSWHRVVNFGYENMKELMRRGLVDFPIKMYVMEPGAAAVCDHRIPDDWYSDRFCETCTPRHLMPMPQRLKIQRQIDSGFREEHSVTTTEGKELIYTTFRFGRRSGGMAYMPYEVRTTDDATALGLNEPKD